jgi:hypothetical protein
MCIATDRDDGSICPLAWENRPKYRFAMPEPAQHVARQADGQFRVYIYRNQTQSCAALLSARGFSLTREVCVEQAAGRAAAGD